MAESTDYFEALKGHLSPEILALPEDKQREYLSELLSHYHRHHREEEERRKVYRQLKRTIEERYKPLHGHLHHLEGWGVVPGFREAVESGDEQAMRALLTEEIPGVYTFDMLTVQCCRELLEEIHHFERWCKDNGIRINRPNTMNRYGAILDDFGFEPVLNKLTEKYVQPFANFLYPGVGAGLNSHHGFVVEYELGKDTNLGFHVDDSEVTLNVCLGQEFTGGQLYFRGVRCDRHVNTSSRRGECYDLEHKLGRGIFHLGKHRHGAKDLTSGYRCNLILWCRSLSQRRLREEACACHTPCPEWCGVHTQTSSS